MALPEWAASPGPTYEHGDNYSDLEVVWTATDTGEVLVQTPHGYIGSEETPAGPLGTAHLDLLAEARGRARAALVLAEEAHARLDFHTPILTDDIARVEARHDAALRRLRRVYLPISTTIGAAGGVIAAHFLR